MADIEMTPVATTALASPPTPSPTLYIKNLNETIKLDVLKKSLTAIFGQYGTIIEIVAHSNIRMRGQAFVVFEEQESSTKAISEVQSFPLYGKPMNIQYSRNKSDAHAKKEGIFEEHHQQRLLTKESHADEFKHKKRTARLAALKKQKQRELEAQQQALLLQQQQQMLQMQQQQQQQQQQGHSAMVPDEFLPRNSILFLQNLPESVAESQLSTLFSQYPGFKEVRMVPGKADIAFVEYDNDFYSEAAKVALANYHIEPDHPIKVTFARK